ncbi:glycosyltransferase family 57 protein [Rhodotorula graminis WP1]|uniref:Alpha-1,3-glucosyltransferase n=1 Tax=Rhodotorula graminis (strain WP1) TaxID=578459 RepID=A0A0P9GJT1_RHOGW|nr:glycosyltransferase family 57 protein [Rhodotorula graminis WP1]KPV73321.1 glycosyltransferase family 57 protein [Rhodotorula graminis WP1]
MTSYAGSTASRRRDHPHAFQRFPTPTEWNAAGSTAADARDLLHLRARKSSLASHHSHDSRSRHPHHHPQGAPTAWDSASESGLSVLSALPTREDRERRAARKAARRAQRERDAEQAQNRHDAARAADATDSPLRRAARWLVEQPALARYSVVVCVAVVVLVKWCTGLGGYSGLAQPPLRGDFEAQRHWIALTSSSLSHLPFLHAPSAPSSSASIPPSRWYYHDLAYWGLDYPPLTAYHSLLLGLVAAWDAHMAALERDGAMKNWMRATVVAGDALVWVSAVAVYCARNFRASTKADKSQRRMLVALMTVLLQPALILIDSGHFQYNSIMLGLTLWSVNCFQAGRDVLGGVLFMLSLGFKQMALYYAPAVFAYLLGKCFWLGGREGTSLFINLALAVTATFLALFAPFLTSLSTFGQALHRIFPFARGLFEDKVANVWCALNVVVKLRDLVPTSTLAKLALVATGTALVPSVGAVLWVSYRLGRERASGSAAVGGAAAPTIVLVPHALFLSAMAFFLLSFQVHEKSILLPLMPLTLLMGAREVGYGRMDWEWGALVNNVAVFSMWPLLQRDGVVTQYLALTALWNYAIGYNPLKLRASFVKYLSCTTYALILAVHSLEALAPPPAHLPDLYPVVNLSLSAGVFGLAWLWAGKRLLQEAWALGGVGGFGEGDGTGAVGRSGVPGAASARAKDR